MSITFKNIKSCRGMDGEAFSATIYDGKTKLGEVMQGGFGGCNDYHFVSKEARATFDAAVGAWVLETGQDPKGFELADSFVAHMLDHLEEQKALKRWMKRGLRFFAKVQEKPYDIGDGTIGYEKETLQAFMHEADLTKFEYSLPKGSKVTRVSLDAE